ncbi:hypothetical protein BGZ49_004152 [Haplosporangium sp. Z 27]|nr:hypothetical protein BGZ49_004152 [Haplosporangium sp. Z 27]
MIFSTTHILQFIAVTMVMTMVVANPIPEPGHTGLLVRKDDFSSKQESRVGAELEKREDDCEANAYWNQNIAGFGGKIDNGPGITQEEHNHHTNSLGANVQV